MRRLRWAERRHSSEVAGGGKSYIQVGQPTAPMAQLVRVMEGKDVIEWNLDEFDDPNKQEANSCLITLLANCLYDHDSRPKGMTMRDLVTFLQFSQSRTEMIIGAWSLEDGVEMIQKVNAAQLISLNEGKMYPVLPPGLYSRDQQLAIVRDKLDRLTMKNFLKKCLSQWYTPSQQWKTK